MHKPIRSPGEDLPNGGFKLDRETEALLYWASSSTSSPLWHLSPGAARNDYRRGLAKTEIVPPEVGETSDFDVSSDAGALRLRKYIPADPNIDAEAVILFVHGGGCVIGDLETHDVFCRALCHDTHATVLSLGFALGPGVLALTGTTGAIPFLTGALIIAVAALPVILAPVKSPIIDDHPHGAFVRRHHFRLGEIEELLGDLDPGGAVIRSMTSRCNIKVMSVRH